MNRCMSPAALGALSALASLSAVIPVMAQTIGSTGEVVVTATRREERLQDVPISLSVFSQEKLDSQGLRSIDDLTRLSPGVAFERNGMGSSANYNDENSDISIRGIDSQAGTSTTGIYIDDTPVGRPRVCRSLPQMSPTPGVRPRTVGLTATYRY